MAVRKSDKIGMVYNGCKVIDSKRVGRNTKYLLECQECKEQFWKCKAESYCHACGNGRLYHNARGYNKKSDPLYYEYHSILRRLKGHDEYKHVKICEEWKNDFEKFKAWALSAGYRKGLTIDREETLKLIERTIVDDSVDIYKVGKLNNYRGLDKMIDWADFLQRALRMIRGARKRVYVKQDLRIAAHDVMLYGNEVIADDFCVR